MNCPACSATASTPHEVDGVAVCSACGAIYTTRHIYKGDSYRIVLPQWETAAHDPETERYYDLSVLGSNGAERRHGWFNPATKRITQTG